MSSEKWGLLPQTYLGSEAQRMFYDVARGYGGHKVKAVVGLVAKDLSVSFDMAFRARKGRIGARAFPEWWDAYHRWLDEQAGKQIEALRARIERLEQDHPDREGLDSQPAVRPGPERARAQSRAG